MVAAFLAVFTAVTGKIPKFKVNGGSSRENKALQNIQARVRMVLAYLFAHLALWMKGKSGGFLVLGSANTDERYVNLLLKKNISRPSVEGTGPQSQRNRETLSKRPCRSLSLAGPESRRESRGTRPEPDTGKKRV